MLLYSCPLHVVSEVTFVVADLHHKAGFADREEIAGFAFALLIMKPSPEIARQMLRKEYDSVLSSFCFLGRQSDRHFIEIDLFDFYGERFAEPGTTVQHDHGYHQVTVL